MSELEVNLWSLVYAGVMSQSDWGSTDEQARVALRQANNAVSALRNRLKP